VSYAKRFFIAGTDTDVGKTFVCAALLRALVRRSQSAVGYKPVCCGDRGDAIALYEASAEPPQASAENLSLDCINPCYLKSPAAPLVAARIENRKIDSPSLLQGALRLEDTYGYQRIVIEGAGGWETPLAPHGVTMADLATQFDAPVLLVIDNKLGALNHTLLTVAAIRARGLHCAGLILNHCRDERDSASISNPTVLAEMLPDIPVLAELLHGESEIDIGTDLWEKIGLL
jgi:dethiobiotin synthetase